MDTKLPEDTFMLLSFINMKLRDEYNSFDELCASLGIDKSAVEDKLRDAGFEYSTTNNKFW